MQWQTKPRSLYCGHKILFGNKTPVVPLRFNNFWSLRLFYLYLFSVIMLVLLIFVVVVTALSRNNVSATFRTSRDDVRQFAHPSNPRLPVSPEAYMTSVSLHESLLPVSYRATMIIKSESRSRCVSRMQQCYSCDGHEGRNNNKSESPSPLHWNISFTGRATKKSTASGGKLDSHEKVIRLIIVTHLWTFFSLFFSRKTK